MSDLLYIHPHAQLLDDWEVPLGALTSVNSVRGSKRGVYAWECVDDEIRAARVVALDWHWHFSLPAVRAVAERIRRLSPETPIVVGGLTASWFGRRTFELLPVDFVAVGDAEAGFDRLVEMGAPRSGPELAPNFMRRDGRCGASVVLQQEAFDRLDSVSVEWFPSLALRRRAPAVMLTRGCDAPCGRTCLASAASAAPLRVHSPEWVGDTVRRIRSLYGPQQRLRLVNVGAQDETALLGTLSRLFADVQAGPLAFWTYGLDAGFLDYLLDGAPDATIGLLSPWEVAGWPQRDVSDEEVEPLMAPVEHLAARLRAGARGQLVWHVPRCFQERRPDLVARVRSERTAIVPSDGYYIWVPESPAGRVLPLAEQVARMESLGALGSRILLVEKLAPFLLELYPMRADPNPEPSPEPPVPELAEFHRLVRAGWQAWNMLAPEPFELEVHVVAWPAAHPRESGPWSCLPAFSQPHPILGGVETRVTATGVELRWQSEECSSLDLETHGLVVLPRGLAEYVGAHAVEVLLLAPPPRGELERLSLHVHADPAGLTYALSWTP